MRTIRVKFKGRVAGAIGKFNDYIVIMSVDTSKTTLDDIEKMLYEKYDHITEIKILL